MEDSPNEDGTGETEQREDERAAILETLLNHDGHDGHSPLGLGHILSGIRERIIGDPAVAATVNWKTALDEFLVSAHNGQPTYARVNRRLHTLGAEHGFIFPANYARSKTNGAVLVDTSGSMGDSDCEEALTHIGTILTAFPDSTINCIQVDTEVRCSVEYTGADFPPTEWQGWLGRGGTDLNPGFRFIQEHAAEFDWAIIITDGEFYRESIVDPGIPVLWVLVRKQNDYLGGNSFPFGRVVSTRA